MKPFIKFENIHVYDSLICDKMKESMELGLNYIRVEIKNINVSMILTIVEMYNSLGYDVEYVIKKNSTTFLIKWS